MTDEPQPSLRTNPPVAMFITAIVCGIAVHDQVTSGSVDNVIVGALVVLAAFWLGRTVDWLGRG